MILSASRRTDIPMCYSEWLLGRLRAGTVLVRNPMNRAQVSRVPLSPETVDCIVFWTKDVGPMLPRLDELEALGYRFYFQFTLTPYGRRLERGLRPVEERMETFLQLGRRVGRDRLVWRYDPIVLGEEFAADWHVERFSELCARLSEVSDTCVISFVDRYQKNRSAFERGLLREIAPEEMADLAGRLAACASRYGMAVSACCEAMDLSLYGVSRASCIDPDRVKKICGYPIDVKPDTNQRPGCGCVESIDIGAYDTCPGGCVYCYANRSPAAVAVNLPNHDPSSELLTGTLSPNDIVREREVRSLRARLPLEAEPWEFPQQWEQMKF